MRAWWWVFLSGCVDADGLIVFLPKKADRYEFPDNRIPIDAIEQITLVSADGTRVSAVIVRGTAGAPWAVYCHGQATNIDGDWSRITALWEQGWSVLAVDYRGYGTSDGEPSEEGLYMDAQAAFDHALSLGVPPARLTIVGFSMGTAVASHLAGENRAAALVLGAPFTSMGDMVEGSAPGGVPPGWVSEVEMDTLARIGGIGMPLVVAHGEADERIPFRMGEEVFRLAMPPKRFLPYEGVHHNDLIVTAAGDIRASLMEIAPNAAPE
jgi:hypothetical protein